MRKNIVFTVCVLLNLSFAYSQVSDDYSSIILDPVLKVIGRTPDALYWKGKQYLIDKTFLSPLNGDDNLYPKLGSFEAIFPLRIKGEIMGRNYYVEWLLKDSVLYLRNLIFFKSEDYYYPDHEQYRIMERFTGHKFRKSPDSAFAKMKPEESVEGEMKATWVNGVFYVKKVRVHPQESLEVWNEKPYHKLTFDKGRMISDETIKPKNKPHLNPDRKTEDSLINKPKYK